MTGPSYPGPTSGRSGTPPARKPDCRVSIWLHTAFGVPEGCLSCEAAAMCHGHQWAMMLGRVPSPALPDLHPGLRLAFAARPFDRVQDAELLVLLQEGAATRR